MRLHEILDGKGREVVTIDPGASVAAAIRLLVRHGIGSVVVVKGEELVGILTERDVLRLADSDPGALALRSVGETMTRDLILGGPEDDLPHVMEVMTTNRVRHLPVVEEGLLHGLISIGDVVNALRLSVESENNHLREYVQGQVR